MPCLDFVEMRRRCGVTQGDLLVEIEKMSPTKKQAAIDVITEMETEAKEKMEIMPGEASSQMLFFFLLFASDRFVCALENSSICSRFSKAIWQDRFAALPGIVQPGLSWADPLHKLQAGECSPFLLSKTDTEMVSERKRSKP